MRFEFNGYTTRTVDEEFDIEVDADSLDEAQDLAYEILSTYPDDSSGLVARRLLRTRVVTHEPEFISIRDPFVEQDMLLVA